MGYYVLVKNVEDDSDCDNDVHNDDGEVDHEATADDADGKPPVVSRGALL